MTFKIPVKLPAFQFYPGDWRKDTGVQSLDYEARGVWFEILCLMHESERRGILELNMRAMPDDALARLLGIPEVLLKQILTKIEAHGVASREPSSGALVCRRMVRDENLRKVRKEAGKQGGNPLLLKQIPTTGVKQKPTPSSSSSSSSSSSDENTAAVEPLPFSSPEFSAAWGNWVAYRKERRLSTLKGISLKGQFKKLAEWGEIGSIESIEYSIRQQYGGLFEPKTNGAPRQMAAPTAADHKKDPW